MLPQAVVSVLASISLAASLIAATAPSDDPAADAGAIADCLARSAIVPMAADADAAPSQQREAAARSLQHALLVVHADALGRAEIERDAAGEAVGLRIAPVSSADADVPPMLDAAIAAVEPGLQDAARGLETTIEAPAAESMAALCSGFDAVLARADDDARAIVSVAIDTQTSQLRIGVDAERSAAALLPRIDALPRAIDDGTPQRAPELTDALGLGSLEVPIVLIADAADTPVSRLHDGDGYGGGSAIRVGGLACSTGFAVRTADRAPAVMSAGHCPPSRGSNGATVVSGHSAQLCGLGSGTAIGRVSQNLLSGSRHVDSMLVRTSAARPTMWLGSACAGTHEVAVHGAGQVGVGDSVGFSGARQGERYAARTSEPAGCYDFGFWSCAVYRATSRQPVPPWSNYACLPGDSGGPAFRHRAGGGVIALGVISASGYDLGINRCSWVDMGTALYLSGATVMTSASLTMDPPTRLAGGDRYQTAAMVAERGYPRGAATVYVASGVGFPDALSAGAAAAHERAPLLLTAAETLPASTRSALQRLAPTQIVLVGGEPSISAMVEAALAEIAPVTRIAGADRYETSALLAQHAFPDGAAEAFVATGRGFPDALAAGPAAARAGAPMLLVPGTDSAPQLDATLDVLGAQRVTVVGGVPSVRESLVASIAEHRAVTRIAGRDRYETAILVNRAFGPTPTAMYLAAGNRFPDALAASAVAGARGEPLLLTPGTCLGGAIPAEHQRLGRPPVVLLGGTPTLAQDVGRYELCG